MNALELADELKALDFWLPMEQRIIAQNSATMLRQQKAEIEALKDEVAMWKMSYENNIRMEDGYGLN